MTKTENFICKAKTLHNDKYDYSLVDYINNKTKVKIICFKHGEFEQYPLHHTKGQGCKKCGSERATKAQRKTTETFKYEAALIHEDKYDYSLVNYVNNYTKVKIICKLHGEFEQVPSDHLRGAGCPHCANLNRHEYYSNTPTQFYIIKYKGLYKVGITTQNVDKRYAAELTDYSEIETLFIRYFSNYTDAYEYEQLIIKLNQKYKYYGEPIFKRTGNTEVFIDLWKESFN